MRSTTAMTLPRAGTWTIDPAHTEIAFVGRHLMLTKVRGRFQDVQGTITTGSDPSETQVLVEIDMASVHSGSPERDEHLRSSDLFDVTTHPTATFRSTEIEWSATSGTMTGELTIKGVTRPVRLAVTFAGAMVDPWGNERVAFSASTRVNREDWGIRWNMPLAMGGLAVSRDIDIEIELEATRQT